MVHVVVYNLNKLYTKSSFCDIMLHNEEVKGKNYKVYLCHTDFCYCELFQHADKKPFKFYMFFDIETLPDNTVGSYQNATKLYLI